MIGCLYNNTFIMIFLKVYTKIFETRDLAMSNLRKCSEVNPSSSSMCNSIISTGLSFLTLEQLFTRFRKTGHLEPPRCPQR